MYVEPQNQSIAEAPPALALSLATPTSPIKHVPEKLYSLEL